MGRANGAARGGRDRASAGVRPEGRARNGSRGGEDAQSENLNYVTICRNFEVEDVVYTLLMLLLIMDCNAYNIVFFYVYVHFVQDYVVVEKAAVST